MSTWDRRSAAVQQRVVKEAVAAWAPLALSSAPAWTRRAAAVDLAPADATTVEQLRRLPPVRPLDLVSDDDPGGADLVMRPTEDQFKAHGSSSALRNVLDRLRRRGQDGRARALLEEYKPIHLHDAGLLTVASSRTDLDRLHRCGARAAAVLGLDTSDYLLGAVPPGPTLEFWGVRHLALGASILAVHARTADGDLARVRAALDLVPATAVAVPPDDAVALAGVMAGAPGTAAIRRVVLVGPPPTDAVRDQVVAAWRDAGASDDVRALALWAPPQARALWAEPDDGTPGLVTYPDLDLVECVDPLTGRTTNGPGDLTITSLGWHGTVLVRLQTGVLVDGVASTEAGGRTVPRVLGAPEPAAWDVRVALRDGPRVVDLRGAAMVLAAAEDVTAWRVEVPDRAGLAHDRLLVEAAGPIDGTRAVELDAALGAAIGAPLTQLVVRADPEQVERRAEAAGGVFADLRT